MISAGAILGAGSLQAQSSDNDIQAKAREALRQKMADLNAKPTPTNSPVPAPTNPVTPVAPIAPVPAPAPVAPVIQVVTPVAPVAPVVPPPAVVLTSPPQTASPELQAQALEALRQKKAELDAQQPVIAPTKAASPQFGAAPAYTSAPITRPAPVFVSQTAPTSVAPPAMLSGPKEQRLEELLQLYKTDKITPAEYHQQRAKILSEP